MHGRVRRALTELIGYDARRCVYTRAIFSRHFINLFLEFLRFPPLRLARYRPNNPPRVYILYNTPHIRAG